MEPRSAHLPGVSGALEIVTGEKIVETGLRSIRSCIVSFVVPNFLPDEEAKVGWYEVPNHPSKIRIRVEKGGLNDGNIGTNPVKISWIAVGD